jgi:hypothetical protein
MEFLFRAFSSVTAASSGACELTDRQDHAESEESVHKDLEDATALLFGAD